MQKSLMKNKKNVMNNCHSCTNNDNSCMGGKKQNILFKILFLCLQPGLISQNHRG